ncbi:unnamed protein product [Mytilus coruscus]|uniref:MIB/HERC2 domain-containing protein n=1 Tax=Mytilus coruscus TaxID=42192 RepID=A0A6J8B3E8_MYTCO|nr:unnamed protein product [Mytilus coruscus]
MKDEIKYMIMAKIKDSSEEIQIMMQKQEELRRDIKNDNRKKDREEMEKQFENVEKGVDSLATHCDLNSTRLNEIKELVFTLSEGVNNITETVRHIKESCVRRIIANGKKSEVVKDRLENVSVSSTVSRNTGCLPNDGCISSPEIVKSYGGPFDDNNLDVDSPSEKNAVQYNNISVSDITNTNCQIDKLYLNGGKVDEKNEAGQIQTLSKSNGKMCRNDLGFKSSSTEWLYDNRVSFHSKGFEGTKCSPVSDVKKTATNKPNIQQQHSDFQDTRSQFQSHRRPASNRRRRHTGFLNVDTADNSIMGLDTSGQPKTIDDWLKHYNHVCEHDTDFDQRIGRKRILFFTPFSLAKSGIDLKSMLDNGGITLSLSSTGISLGSSLDGIDLYNHAGVESVVHSVVELQTKVFYVQIGKNQKNAILERVVKETNGKMLDTREMHRLVQMNKVIIIAARIASNIIHSSDQSKESIKQQIKEESGCDDPYNDCLDMVLEFVNPLSVEKRRGYFTELTCRSLQLGDRVRRGPDWHFGNQDNHLAGTVIGQQSHGIARVQWDNGDTNIYRQCDETNTYNLRKVDEPRILVDEMIAVGCRVVRGHDWKFGNRDGGVGSLGTVLDVRPEGKVVVRWDSKRTGLYKMGHNGRFEIKVHGAPVRSRSKRNKHRSEYKSPHTSDSESENESLRPKFRTTGANATQEPMDYVIPIYSDATVSAIWEYEEGSEWKKYPNDINVKIEKAYQRKKTGKTIIEMDRTTIQVIRQKNPSAEKIKLGDNKENMSAENGKLNYIKLYTL